VRRWGFEGTHARTIGLDDNQIQMAAGSQGIYEVGRQAKRFAAGNVGLADEQNLAVLGYGRVELGQQVGLGLPLWVKGDVRRGMFDLRSKDTGGGGSQHAHTGR
jgi:hypothetical protein